MAARVLLDKDLAGATNKATPVAADRVLISDSEASGAMKSVQLGAWAGGNVTLTDEGAMDFGTGGVGTPLDFGQGGV